MIIPGAHVSPHQIELLLQSSARERKTKVRVPFWMTDSMLEENGGRWVEIKTGEWWLGEGGCMHECFYDKTCSNQFQIKEMIWGEGGL